MNPRQWRELALRLDRIEALLESMTYTRPQVDLPVAEPVLLDVLQVCELMSIGRTTAYQLLSSGRLTSVRIGRRRLIPRSSVDEFLASVDVDGPKGDQP